MIYNDYINAILEKKGAEKDGMHIANVIKDYWAVSVSREVSMLGRKEVLTGKAKFGILGDGKELPQIVMSRFFRKGDWRSGYYRDQSFMFAAGLCSVRDFFAQLYADSSNDPFSRGRQMNAHFATRTIDDNGEFLDLKNLKNVSSDISPTAGQMARGLGLAMASKIYRNNPDADTSGRYSQKGEEISFVTIGDASTSEGIFWESINAAAVNKVPMCVIVWDDGYGISVPKERQTVKGSISEALAGFEIGKKVNGINIYKVKAYDYIGLHQVFETATRDMRKSHTPALIHVTDVTQPQGHSTSGSHERYKSADRLAWEVEYDCIKQMKQWIISEGLVSEEELDEIAAEAVKFAREEKKAAWDAFENPIKVYKEAAIELLNSVGLTEDANELVKARSIQRDEIVHIVRAGMHSLNHQGKDVSALRAFLQEAYHEADYKYHSELYSNSDRAAVNVPIVSPVYDDSAKQVNGFQLLNAFFDEKLTSLPQISAFGEDVGDIGDVNQGFAGLQAKHGVPRVFDTGIREWSIMGMAIGMSMRGLRPIAEIQYLDYLIYGLSPLSDDLATLRYRSGGIQAAPAIIRTRGHRLEGVWHSGSPMGMIINACRGLYVAVPRNMTQAAGMYNTLLQSDDPAIVVECLNGYRLKEKMPSNIGEYTVPLGVPEVINRGSDVTVVTYGSIIREVMKAVTRLEQVGISVEVVDVQTLLPFDMEGHIVESLKKTNRVLFVDEDVPGGATAFMMKQVVEDHNGYQYLDALPRTLTAHAHRPPYGSEGDYYSKPNSDDVYEVIYNMMAEAEPSKYIAIS